MLGHSSISECAIADTESATGALEYSKTAADGIFFADYIVAFGERSQTDLLLLGDSVAAVKLGTGQEYAVAAADGFYFNDSTQLATEHRQTDYALLGDAVAVSAGKETAVALSDGFYLLDSLTVLSEHSLSDGLIDLSTIGFLHEARQSEAFLLGDSAAATFLVEVFKSAIDGLELLESATRAVEISALDSLFFVDANVTEERQQWLRDGFILLDSVDASLTVSGTKERIFGDGVYLTDALYIESAHWTAPPQLTYARIGFVSNFLSTEISYKRDANGIKTGIDTSDVVTISVTRWRTDDETTV